MRLFACIPVPTAFIVAVALLLSVHYVSAAQAPLPSRASVEAISQTLQSLDHPFGLAIIAATPAHPGPKNPYSIPELEAHLALINREKAFLEGISCAETHEVAKAKARAYLARPSARSADSLELTLRLLIRQLHHDVEAPLWRVMVPSAKTAPIQLLTRQLERQVNFMRTARAVEPGPTETPQRPTMPSVAPDGRAILYPSTWQALALKEVFESGLEMGNFVIRGFERARKRDSTMTNWVPIGVDLDTMETLVTQVRSRCDLIDNWVVEQNPSLVSGVVYLRFVGPNNRSMTWSWRMPKKIGSRDYKTEFDPADYVPDPLKR